MPDKTFKQALRTARHAFRAKDFQAALALCSRLIALQPAPHEALHLSALCRLLARELVEALEDADDAIALRPESSLYQTTRGRILAKMNRLDEALAAHERAIALDESSASGHFYLGIALRISGAHEQAANAMQRACAINPRFAGAFQHRGHALRLSGDYDGAAEAYARAVELKPTYIEARNNLGITLNHLARHGAALECFDAGLRIDPDNATLQSNRLYGMHFNPALSSAEISDAHRVWGRRVPVWPVSGFENERSPQRRLKIGLLAPDFRAHCQSFFTLPLLMAHDRACYEFICYHDSKTFDQTTRELQRHADGWRTVHGSSDAALAEQLRTDRIDVLIELTQHMAENRLAMLARRPAPVQISWLGYPAATGLDAIDARLSDPFLDPPDRQTDFDRVVRLENTFWCYDPHCTDIFVNALPSDSSGAITFGCLNNFCKTNPAMLGLWGELLSRLPSSQLKMLAPQGVSRDEALRHLALESARVQFLDFLPRKQYLQQYHQIDICLDTFPYNGHTTSLDALWMGVPVVSLHGQTAVSRAGLSQLSNLGLPELVTDNSKRFIEIAVALAEDRSRLRNLRSTLRSRMKDSPLMDAPRFARSFEAACRSLWQQWCGTSKSTQTTPKEVNDVSEF